MASPMNGAIYAHKAIRKEPNELEEEAARLESADASWISEFAERVAFFHSIVKGHNTGEEEVAWPAIDARFPNVTLPYTLDHRADEETFQEIERLLAKTQDPEYSADRGDAVRSLRRLFTSLNVSITGHANREDAHIIPILQENFTTPEQGEMAGRMVRYLPGEEMPRIVPMMVMALTPEERADYVGAMKQMMPPEAFSAAAGWIKAGIPEGEWSELSGRVPELATS